ncbi:hypothetical protein J437_LFUL004978 [Ladona fulva]|uniref:Sulfatase N-terminal domain-containing protein n=1 Tax=Ladona fulva TaxID=123851 RepID=A0A8K0NWG4_LADFU|nr:hypothetical protein J437_LFUL004978 [Ladona fulva]
MELALLHIMNYSTMHCYLILTLMVLECYERVSGLDIGRHGNMKKRNAINSRPNVVVLLADDVGWGDLGANGEQDSSSLTDFIPKSVTPILDKLAKKGLRFTDFHTGASVCSPSRAALLTSRLGLRTGVVQNFAVDSAGGLPENETTVAKVLLDAGYRTAMFGKWHLGLTKGHHPLDHGFQSYLGVPYSLDMGCTNPPGVNIPMCPGCEMGYDMYDRGLLQCVQNIALPLISNRTIVQQPVKLEKISSAMAYFAEDFIMNRYGNSDPFFLYGAFSQAHVPLLTEHGSNQKEKVFNETLSEMDDIVRRILIAVEKSNHMLKKAGLPTQETLIWFLKTNVERIMLHPNSGASGPNGEIGAVRIGSYKAVFYTGGAASCGGYTPPEDHSRNPLVFNLAVDPAESEPLSPLSEKYWWFMSKVTNALSDFYMSLKVDNTSVTDYSVNDMAKPCCSRESHVCRCPWDMI